MKSDRTKSSGPSQRQLRVGEAIRHIIAQTLQRGHFNNEVMMNAAALVTVTEVRVTPDLKNARAYVMALGGHNMDVILPALNDQAHVFQKEINRQADLKFTPKVKFIMDESFGEAQRIDDILRSIHIPKDSEE